MTRPQDKTILVVDDEPNVRTYLKTLLEDAGFKVVIAGDGVEALEIIRKSKPDFISLDLIMPRKSGQKLLFELRRDRELSRIPVLIVTAHARDDLGAEDLTDLLRNRVISGPGSYLEKPIDPVTYVRSIQSALGIEVSEEAVNRLGLKEELRKSLEDASPEALRKALEALRKAGG
ncbi:MAG: response regulator [Candidatus Riflebacteria bacterium]|nr:response regulator [Candidatus Riflebacteria bacterium]